ncbi:MAG: thiol reductant ABC exporter subunit CydD [Acetobacteraceae bacterium]
MEEQKRVARTWVRAQTAAGRAAARPVILLALAGTLLAIGQAWCAGMLLGGFLRGGRGGVGWLAAGFALAALARAGLGVLAERAAFSAGAAARRRLRSEALGALLATGPALLRRSHSGELTASVIDRIEALEGLFARWIPAATLALAGPALVALAALAADPTAALVLVAAGLAVPVAMALSGIGAAAASRRQFLAMTHLQARFLDRVRGIATIVLAGRTEDEARALARAAAELRVRTMRVLRVAFLSSAALDAAAAAALVGLAIRYALLLRAGALAGPGTALFVLLLVPEFFAPLRAFSAAYQDRMHAAAAAESLSALPPVPAAPAILPVRTVAAQGVSVAFEDVVLVWDPARGPALDGLSFRVPAGETLILAGPSGAGKSTVIEILLGFVRPDRGRVTINGADITSLVPQALARFTAWVGQRPMLFAGTIAENIRFARPEATDAEVAEAARLAHVDRFAAELPRGLETPVGEGGFGLSGGQAQRIAIARAFLKDAPLLLLDEPTAHLDPLSEGEVLEGLRRLALGRTVILATHSALAHGFGGRRLDLRAGRAVAATERGAA